MLAKKTPIFYCCSRWINIQIYPILRRKFWFFWWNSISSTNPCQSHSSMIDVWQCTERKVTTDACHHFCGFLCLLLLLLMDLFAIIVWWISLSVPHLEFIAFPHCWDNPAVFILTHKRPLQFKSALSSKYIWLVAALLMSDKPRYGSQQ